MMDVTKSLDYERMFSAKDLVVVITGGGTGIGLAFASALAQTGAKRVYILGRRREALDKAVTTINAKEGVVVPIVCDVTNPFTVTTAVQQIEKDTGYVDVLVNNAGVGGPNHKAMYEASNINDLKDIMLDDWPGWTSTFAINTNSVVLLSAHFLPLLEKGNERRGWASGKLEVGGSARTRKEVEDVDISDVRSSQIISVASIAAFNRYVTHGLSYGASKAAATYLGKTLSSVLGPWGIRSNVICPGIFPSEMTTGSPDQFPFDRIPAGRQGTFDEISGVILSLVGRSGAYTNGQVVLVDGGRLTQMPTTY